MPRDQVELKKDTVMRLFNAFKAKMEHCLRTGEELGPRFAAIAREKVFKKRIQLENGP